MSAPPQQPFDAPRAPVVDAPARRAAPSRRTRGRAAALALPIVASAAPLVAAPASATDYAYTSECRITAYSDGKAIYRKFRARVARSQNGSNWALSRYAYTYTIDPQLNWGPHSDERVDVVRGHVSGPDPWHSPDSHTSNVAWVSETGWKGSTDIGRSQVKFHAWFDVPSTNDPECDVYTSVF